MSKAEIDASSRLPRAIAAGSVPCLNSVAFRLICTSNSPGALLASDSLKTPHILACQSSGTAGVEMRSSVLPCASAASCGPRRQGQNSCQDHEQSAGEGAIHARSFATGWSWRRAAARKGRSLLPGTVVGRRGWTRPAGCCKLAGDLRRRCLGPCPNDEGVNHGEQHPQAGDAHRGVDHPHRAPQTQRAGAQCSVAGGHAQGRVAVSRRCPAQDLARRRAAFPWPHHQPRGARPA